MQSRGGDRPWPEEAAEVTLRWARRARHLLPPHLPAGAVDGRWSDLTGVHSAHELVFSRGDERVSTTLVADLPQSRDGVS